jgi:PAS domain-containing protein
MHEAPGGNVSTNTPTAFGGGDAQAAREITHTANRVSLRISTPILTAPLNITAAEFRRLMAQPTSRQLKRLAAGPGVLPIIDNPVAQPAMGRAVEVFRQNAIERDELLAERAAAAERLEHLVEERTAELSEALEQQTATAEVLGVINSSPGDLVPVFDVMLDKAMQLCGAAFGVLQTYEEQAWCTVATHGMPTAYAEFRKDNPPAYSHPGTAPARLLAGERVVHIVDLKDEDAYRSGDPNRQALVDMGGARTSLHVALVKNEKVRGCIQLYNNEVRPFSDKQVTLLENFAGQAVIAMDNARLLDEIRQRQAELHVTFDNMADGVAMFDAELRLAAWNRYFQHILDLPDAFLAETRALAEIVRFLALRGEFGAADPEAEVQRLVENTGRHYSYERTRPDGRVLEVRHNPVPGGGFVVIYGDITERKRSEAEIREARDAAESALGELKTAQASLIQAIAGAPGGDRPIRAPPGHSIDRVRHPAGRRVQGVPQANAAIRGEAQPVRRLLSYAREIRPRRGYTYVHLSLG